MTRNAAVEAQVESALRSALPKDWSLSGLSITTPKQVYSFRGCDLSPHARKAGEDWVRLYWDGGLMVDILEVGENAATVALAIVERIR